MRNKSEDRRNIMKIEGRRKKKMLKCTLLRNGRSNT